jgi:hypothetical protein
MHVDRVTQWGLHTFNTNGDMERRENHPSQPVAATLYSGSWLALRAEGVPWQPSDQGPDFTGVSFVGSSAQYVVVIPTHVILLIHDETIIGGSFSKPNHVCYILLRLTPESAVLVKDCCIGMHLIGKYSQPMHFVYVSNLQGWSKKDRLDVIKQLIRSRSATGLGGDFIWKNDHSKLHYLVRLPHSTREA